MKKQMLKAILSLSLVVAMLLTTVLPAWAAEESFELFFGEDLVNLSLYEWATLVYSGVDENVTVSVEAATDGVIELDTENNMFRAVGVGSTVLVATTSDGQSDRALISVREPQAWNGPGTYRVLINGQFPSVLAAFTVPEDGIYEITSDAPYVLYGEILDAEGEYMAYDPMDTYDTGLFLVDRLEAGKTYYLYTYSSEITLKAASSMR